MNVLLDECLPRKLKREFVGHHIATVPEMGWSGTKNGSLLRLAEASFDVFVTADQNLQYQQNLHSTLIGIIVLVAPNTRFDTLQSLFPQVIQALLTIHPGDVVTISR